MSSNSIVFFVLACNFILFEPACFIVLFIALAVANFLYLGSLSLAILVIFNYPYATQLAFNAWEIVISSSQTIYLLDNSIYFTDIDKSSNRGNLNALDTTFCTEAIVLLE